MFDILAKEIGAIILREYNSRSSGKTLVIGHGDEIDNRKLSFRFLRALFRNRFLSVGI